MAVEQSPKAGPAPDLVEPRGLVVALDGPASSGKSSVGAAASARLGYRFCDTGLLYRAVTWLAIHRRVGPDETHELVDLVDEIHLLDDGTGRLAHVAVDDVDRTAEVRGPDVDAAVSSFSGVAELRAALLERQRSLAEAGRIIMAGRDIGTVVLPDADLKIFLDASVEERAARRSLERGVEPRSLAGWEILQELRRRDELDSTRAVAPLRAADDALVLKTDGNTFEITVSLVVNAIRRAEAEHGPGDDVEPGAPEPHVPKPVEPQAVVTVAGMPAADAAGPAPPVTAATAAAADPVVVDETAGDQAEDRETGVDEARNGEDAAIDDVSPAPDRPATPDVQTMPPNVEPAPARRTTRPPRKGARRPMQPTPVATHLDPVVRLGSALLRLVVRGIVRLRVDGDLAAIPRQGPLIVAANHASSADPILIGAFLNSAINRPLNWLGKRELTEWAATGWAFRRAGIHPVDRDAADLESFRTAMRILDAGQVLAVFPEGTRSRDGALQPVREGVGMLALRSGAWVLPVAVVDSDLMWPRGRLLPRFGRKVTVRYGTAFDVGAELAASGEAVKGRAATEAATRLVMARIAALLPPRQRGVYGEPGSVPVAPDERAPVRSA